MGDATAIFSIHDQKDIEIHEVVQQVYDALKEKGYNPVNQLWAISCPKILPISRLIRGLVPSSAKWTVTTCCRLCCAAI